MTTRSLSMLLSISFLCLSAASLIAQTSNISARPPWTTSRIHGSPTPPEPYQVKKAFPAVRFDKPSSLLEIPGGERILVTEITGNIYTFRKIATVERADLALDLKALLPSELKSKGVSLFSAVLHPDLANNRFVFVCYVHPGDGGHTRVSRFQMTAADPPTLDGSSEQVVITWPSGGHNAGCLRFGKDGFLYIATGDGFGPNPPDNLNTGQDVSDLLGSILRIDVDNEEDGKNYAIPRDNPFLELEGARGEIWAYGLRNPWKFGVDRVSGEIFVADNGWESWEMIHRIQRGGNCGWPIMEGRALLRAEVAPGPTPIIPPVKDHPHSEANSVIGGPVYRGVRLAGLDGSFVYGDYITGTIWALKTDGEDEYSHRTLVDTDLRIVDFAEGGKGELYVLDYDLTGQIYEIVPAETRDSSEEFPRKLSETGLFTQLEDFQPAPGVIPYRVKASRWHDGARARRWIAIPGSKQVDLDADGKAIEFPEGTVFVKHLELALREENPKPVETQLLHYEGGQWRPYSYLWDDAGADAELVSSIGLNWSLRIPNKRTPKGYVERTWRVGAQNECKLCHNAGSGYVLGFNAQQLDVSGRLVDQLAALAGRRVLESTPKTSKDDPGRLVNPHDTTQSLEDRARSYLHVNCSSCHHPGGNAIVSFYLRRDMPLEKLNTNKGTGIGTFGIDHAKILTPGDPYRSVLTYRMSKLGYARMPYIGSQVVDSRGVALVAAWIRSLKPLEENPASDPVREGTADSDAIATLQNRSANDQQRADAVQQLLASTEGALALVDRMHQRSLHPEAMQAAVSLGSKTRGDVSGLFDHFIPEADRRAKLGPNIFPETVLDKNGDAARGRLIFFSDAARCRNCHELDQPEKSVGPTLRDIAKKYPRRSEMLEHVLKPSLKIEDKFATYLILLNDGRIISGLLTENTDRGVEVKTAEGKLVPISRKDIEEMRKSPRSLMPEKILSDLTAQEAADLIAYILSLHAGAD